VDLLPGQFGDDFFDVSSFFETVCVQTEGAIFLVNTTIFNHSCAAVQLPANVVTKLEPKLKVGLKRAIFVELAPFK
jgi:hypothetical protein